MAGQKESERWVAAVAADEGLRQRLRSAGREAGWETVLHASLEEVSRDPRVGEIDVLLVSLASVDSSLVRQAAEWVDERAQGIRLLVILEAARATEIDSVFVAGADECLVGSFDDRSLRRCIARLIDARRAAIRSLLLHETIRIMEDCRPLAYCLEPGQLYPMTLELILRATSRRRGFTLFKRENVPQSDAVALRGFEQEDTGLVCRTLLGDKSIDFDAFEGLAVLRSGVLHDALRAADVEVSALLVVSLGGEGRESGIVALFDDDRPFGPEDVDRADIVTRHGIAALENSATYALAKERAYVDDVTQAYNAGYLLRTCENEIQRSERYGTPLSVLFLDLDHFKTVNDEYGHLVGSEALRRLCRVLEQCVRQVDTLARYGGDEFSIILVDTDHATALQVAERIRRRIDAYVFEVDRDVRLSLTLSIGVATCPTHGVVRDRILDLADKAMYRAKSEGRNRICSANEVLSGAPDGYG
ncbi:MAG: GGDEF domain-containing protein [Myxococcota bacterium]|nr:GGDEF domain-containing protein [Myxococcota bacterium]